MQTQKIQFLACCLGGGKYGGKTVTMEEICEYGGKTVNMEVNGKTVNMEDSKTKYLPWSKEGLQGVGTVIL
jgi:predicted ATPase